MRILLAIHNAYTDATSGAAHNVRITMQWLAAGGHRCRVLCTARFDARPPDNFEAHLAGLGVPLTRRPASDGFLRRVRKRANIVAGRPTVDFTLAGVPVTVLVTRSPKGTPAEAVELEQFLFLLDETLREFQPDIVFTYGGAPVVQEVLRRAQVLGAITVFTLQNFGYEHRRYFQNTDHVFTCSAFLSDHYQKMIGLRSTPLDSPIDWEEVEAPEDLRQFVTFVNPSRHKGALLFARLADMLGRRRPDIPILVVQSARSAGLLNDIPGLDFTRHQQIKVAPATERPADFFALTKVLLVPSVFHEPFGRVAAESLINGIPPLVSDRGSLPDTVRGAGRVLPLPVWLTEKSTELPSEVDAQPWFDAVCELWDDADAYARAAAACREAAHRWYAEATMRRRYLDYFAGLDRRSCLFNDPPSAAADSTSPPPPHAPTKV